MRRRSERQAAVVPTIETGRATGASAADASAFSLKLLKDCAGDWQSLTAADVDDITPMTSYEISP
jgi:hypothetical protein